MSKQVSKIIEAKIQRQLVSLAPKGEGEQNFVDLHTIDYTMADKYLEPNNGIFNVADKVKTFNRSKNRFGNDEIQSIKKYDKRNKEKPFEESVSLQDRLMNAHKHKKIRRIFDKDGNWVDTDFNSPTNKRAIETIINRAASKIMRKNLTVVKEQDSHHTEKEKPEKEISNKDKFKQYIHDMQHLEHELESLERKTEKKKIRKEYVSEALSNNANVKDWIDDFVNSTNPKFDGKSKEKRRQMAIAAYYAEHGKKE